MATPAPMSTSFREPNDIWDRLGMGCSHSCYLSSSGPEMSIPAQMSTSFCVPHETQLVVTRNSIFSADLFTITDEKGNLMFKVKSTGIFNWSTNRRIYDDSGKLIVLLVKKERKWFGSAFLAWVAFRGDSESELLWTFQRMFSSQVSSPWLVMLPGKAPVMPTFILNSSPGSSLTSSSKYTIRVYNGNPIAETEAREKGVYHVKIYPGVDRAFVAALTTCSSI